MQSNPITHRPTSRRTWSSTGGPPPCFCVGACAKIRGGGVCGGGVRRQASRHHQQQRAGQCSAGCRSHPSTKKRPWKAGTRSARCRMACCVIAGVVWCCFWFVCCWLICFGLVDWLVCCVCVWGEGQVGRRGGKNDVSTYTFKQPLHQNNKILPPQRCSSPCACSPRPTSRSCRFFIYMCGCGCWRFFFQIPIASPPTPKPQ